MKTSLTRKSAALLLVVASLLATATVTAAPSRIYKTVDEHGNTVFTDIPPKEGDQSEAIAVEPTNTFRPASPAAAEDQWIVDPAEEDSPAPFKYSSLTITSPGSGESVRENAGNVSVVAEVEPALQVGHRMRILLDGIPEQEGSQTSFTLSNVDRGAHSVTVEIVDDAGQIVLASAPTTFQLQRFSTQNAPNRPTPTRRAN